MFSICPGPEDDEEEDDNEEWRKEAVCSPKGGATPVGPHPTVSPIKITLHEASRWHLINYKFENIFSQINCFGGNLKTFF